jgi:hypothetical protein
MTRTTNTINPRISHKITRVDLNKATKRVVATTRVDLLNIMSRVRKELSITIKEEDSELCIRTKEDMVARVGSTMKVIIREAGTRRRIMPIRTMIRSARVSF